MEKIGHHFGVPAETAAVVDKKKSSFSQIKKNTVGHQFVFPPVSSLISSRRPGTRLIEKCDIVFRCVCVI